MLAGSFWPAAAVAQTATGSVLAADRICRADDAADAASAARFPGDAALMNAADAVERRLVLLRARGDASSVSSADLAVPLTETRAPAPAALVRYCAAAGELMRLSAQGSQRQALTYLLTAYRTARASGDPAASRAAYRLALVGVAEPGADGTRGATTRGRRSGEEAVPLGQRAAMPPEGACEELNGAGVAALTAREVSLLALACAADQSLRTGNRSLAALANLKLARLEGSYAELPGEDRETFRGFARERAQRAIDIALALDAGSERTELLGRLAETAVAFGDTGSPALVAALGALSTNRSDPAARGIASATEAQLALARGDAEGARRHAEAAVLAESRRPVPARLPTFYLLLAGADPTNRAAHVHAAYTALENLRPLLPRLDPLTEESSFALYMRDVFVAAAELQLASAHGPEEAARIERAQEIVEAYRQAELQSAFGSECLPPRQSARAQALQPGETILYPLLLPDRVELLVVSSDEGGGGSRYRRLPPNRAVGRAEVARLVEAVSMGLSYGADDSWRPAARRLYDILIAPVADRLTGPSMLAVVPDGALRALPFAALIGPDGRYLVQRTRLSIIPALAFAQPAGTRADGGLRIVAASLQREMNLPVGVFPALEGTEAEARIAVGHATPGRLLPDFTRADLLGALGGRLDILHLATHAAFNGRSDRAFIVANGEVIRLSELRTMLDRTRLRGDAVDLIILSACETAVGDDEASMGLAGAAVQAGARSVIGSLWQVNDAGTADLMRHFYRRYSAGRSRSEALREAQIALIEGGGGNADPNVWAAFALLGAWR